MVTASERARNWNLSHPELAKKYAKQYRERRKLSDPDYYRRRNYKAKYKMTIEDFDKMLANQNGVCYICKETNGDKRLAVDHCHISGQVRKLLCNSCNLTIEHLENAKTDLSKYVQYVKDHQLG